MGCEVFCLGTEFSNFAMSRPSYWLGLIDTVRSIYAGKITYAANWDVYDDIVFWNKLDYIGVDAYFPISEEQTPSVDVVEASWLEDVLPTMEEVSDNFGKQVIFTEFGYRSVDYAGKEPWNSEADGNVNLEAQQNAYHGMFNAFDQVHWFEGGFVWKWHVDQAAAGGEADDNFTPQNKPAASFLNTIYGSN